MHAKLPSRQGIKFSLLLFLYSRSLYSPKLKTTNRILFVKCLVNTVFGGGQNSIVINYY